MPSSSALEFTPRADADADPAELAAYVLQHAEARATRRRAPVSATHARTRDPAPAAMPRRRAFQERGWEAAEQILLVRDHAPASRSQLGRRLNRAALLSRPARLPRALGFDAAEQFG